MSLLTKEQQETLERIRKAPFDPAASYDDLCTAIAIIDYLQSRAPKQYTEAQMRTAFEHQLDHGKSLESFITPDGRSVSGLSVYAKHGWMACARFLGALKAEP